jgi:hypothetical protein
MKESVRRTLFVLLVVLMVLTFYAIFNAGNPRSLLRYLVRDTAYDVAITLVLSFGVLVVVLVLTAESTGRLKGMLDMNRDYILELRRKGRSDAEIADSFLHELKAPPGLLRSLARGRVLRYLARLK